MGHDEIDAQAGFGPGELGVVIVQGVAEHGGRVGVAVLGQRVTAPAGQVDGVKGEVWPVVKPARRVRE